MTGTTRVLLTVAAVALSACAATIGGSSETAIAADSVTLPAPDRAGSDAGLSAQLLCDRTIDDFASSPAGAFPAAWETWRDADLEDARRDRAFTVVSESEEALLRVRPATRELSIGRGIEGWNLRAYPVLEWRWRLSSARADQGPGDDHQPLARVGAVWLTGFPFIVRRIEYTWSASRPLATQDSSRFGQDRTIVVASSESGAGEWHTVRVDVRRHYATLFSSDTPNAPAGIAVTVGKSNPGSQTVVDYRSFRLCRYTTSAAEQP